MKNMDDYSEISAIEIMEDQYREAENKSEIDFWIPLSKIIIESISIRDQKSLSQGDLAKLMKTKQSVISRFENMGRKPNYNFISRLAIALGHPLGMTLYGDFMAVVSDDKQHIIRELAMEENLSTEVFTQQLLDEAVEYKALQHSFRKDGSIHRAGDFLDDNYQGPDSAIGSYISVPPENTSVSNLTA